MAQGQCKDCRFYDGRSCSVNGGQPRTPTSTCGKWGSLIPARPSSNVGNVDFMTAIPAPSMVGKRGHLTLPAVGGRHLGKRS